MIAVANPEISKRGGTDRMLYMLCIACDLCPPLHVDSTCMHETSHAVRLSRKSTKRGGGGGGGGARAPCALCWICHWIVIEVVDKG